MEIWKPHPRYRYLEVSNLGNARTIRGEKVKNLSPFKQPTTKGYYLGVSVTEIATGKQKSVPVHRLVAELFVVMPDGLDPAKAVPNHDDGNKCNNAATNLEWMTQQQNLQHAIDTGLRKMVDENGAVLYINKSKPVKVTNLETGSIEVFSSAKAAAEYTGVPARTVQYNAFKRKVKAPVKGFAFEENEPIPPI